VPPYQLTSILSNLPTDPASEPLLVHFISDGSQIEEMLSFGWTLSLSDGTRLAYCARLGFGPRTSHRAEGYGVLSAMCFVACLQAFVATTAAWPIRFTTDNQGLLTRIGQERQQYLLSYANSTLTPDRDLVEEIFAQLRQLSITTTFTHVKGRQDDHTNCQ
jgi:hypothetical protein